MFDQNTLKKNRRKFIANDKFTELISKLFDDHFFLLNNKFFNNILSIGVYGWESILKNLAMERLHLIDYHNNSKYPIDITDNLETLQLKNNFFNLIISNFTIHKIDNLNGHLSNIKESLANNGCFFGFTLSPKTLYELRTILIEYEGHDRNRMYPFIDIDDIVKLLKKNKFIEPVITSNDFKVNFKSILSLFHNIIKLGEGNATIYRNPKLSISDLCNINKLYQKKYNGILATFEIISFICYKN
ncbi:MAG: hypothetical protein OEY79_02945 [Anaplasmataceae bacterium]|nr:hypothetical protein [Anaplasmataceae bacterium]